MEYSTRGQHVAVDLWGVEFSILNHPRKLKKTMKTAVLQSGAKLIGTQKKKFHPQGVTIVFLLEESHMSIHTYPEKGFAAVDCYTCGENVSPMCAVEYMIAALKAKKWEIVDIERGTHQMEIQKKQSALNE